MVSTLEKEIKKELEFIKKYSKKKNLLDVEINLSENEEMPKQSIIFKYKTYDKDLRRVLEVDNIGFWDLQKILDKIMNKEFEKGLEGYKFLYLYTDNNYKVIIKKL